MEVRDAITLMIAFGVLIISLIGLVVNIVDAMTKKK
ncbi:putative holin-like toxin [Paenibacillus sp. 598K]|nr:putative holin-like toxin [Paenibacillus sp. 598K]